MGTRADFYIGRGADAKWLGSIAWDGYPDGIDAPVLAATTEAEFLAALKDFAETRKDWTDPSQGWPWPWNDSGTTDYAYALDDGKVWASPFGYAWFDPMLPQPEREEAAQSAVFPDMSDIKNVTYGPRSGVMVFAVK